MCHTKDGGGRKFCKNVGYRGSDKMLRAFLGTSLFFSGALGPMPQICWPFFWNGSHAIPLLRGYGFYQDYLSLAFGLAQFHFWFLQFNLLHFIYPLHKSQKTKYMHIPQTLNQRPQKFHFKNWAANIKLIKFSHQIILLRIQQFSLDQAWYF